MFACLRTDTIVSTVHGNSKYSYNCIEKIIMFAKINYNYTTTQTVLLMKQKYLDYFFFAIQINVTILNNKF